MGRLLPDRLASCGVKGGDVLIETGSDIGWSLRHVAGLFQEVHTVEIDPALVAVSKARVARQKMANITVHQGNSPEVLKRIIDPLRETVFWLDAHFVAGEGRTCHGVQCPLMQELAAIFSFQWLVPPVIICDDARMFQEWFWTKTWSAEYDKRQWPRQAEIAGFVGRHAFAVSNVRGMLLIALKGGE